MLVSSGLLGHHPWIPDIGYLLPKFIEAASARSSCSRWRWGWLGPLVRVTHPGGSVCVGTSLVTTSSPRKPGVDRKEGRMLRGPQSSSGPPRSGLTTSHYVHSISQYHHLGDQNFNTQTFGDTIHTLIIAPPDQPFPLSVYKYTHYFPSCHNHLSLVTCVCSCVCVAITKLFFPTGSCSVLWLCRLSYQLFVSLKINIFLVFHLFLSMN